MSKIRSALVMGCLALLCGAGVADAQSSDLQLVLNRNFGFAMGNQIQGSFDLAVAGPVGMTSVTYRIDGQDVATVTQAPFRYTFSTDSYTSGKHKFSARAKTAAGQTLESNVIDAEFISSADSFQSMARIIGPILGIVFVVLAVMVAIQFLPGARTRRSYDQKGAITYGPAGGTICKRCGRPFARNFLSPNLIAGKLERCPYCGKWNVTQRASAEALRAAEQAQSQAAMPTPRELAPEEHLRQQIEDSRMTKL